MLVFCLLCAAAPLWAAETSNYAYSLSSVEALGFASRLLDSGHIGEAEKLYTQLLRSSHREISTEAAFKLGLIAMSKKDYNRAIELFIAILNQQPNLARVRLELARLYFILKNYDDARQHFELVKGDQNLPPPVLEKVDAFLDLIRRQRNWSTNFGFALVPDSNINQVSAADEECIWTVFGLLCREREKKKSGVGAHANMSFDYYLKFNKNFGLRNSVGVDITEYKQSQYDDYILHAATGPRYVFDSGEISLQPTYQRRWVGHDKYSQSYGLRLDGQKDFKRVLAAGGLSYRRNVYDKDYIDDALRGDEYSAYVLGRYIVNPQSFVQARLRYIKDNTNMDMYGSDSTELGVGAYYIFKYGLSVFTELSMAESRYHDSQYYIGKDYFIDETTREDKIYNLSVELRTNILEHKGIRPVLRYGYTKRDSNIWSYEYDRHRLMGSIDYRF